MIVRKEVSSIDELNLWSGAKSTREKIIQAEAEDAFMEILEDMFPDGVDECDLNDFMWFQADRIFAMLGLDDEGNIIDYDISLDSDSYEIDLKAGTLKIDKSIFDDFDEDSIIKICFLDLEGEPRYEYKMISEDDDWIYLEFFD